MNSLYRSENTLRSSTATYFRLISASFLSVLVIFVLSLTTAQAAAPGALDLTFGVTGVVTEDTSAIAGLSTVQSDGKIVAVGGIRQSTWDFWVIKYNPDGSVDNSFGTNGSVTTDFDGQTDYAVAGEIIQSDGKILVGGYGEISEDVWHFKVARFLPDGSLDTSFGTDGKAVLGFSGYSVNYPGMILQPDGKILLTGIDVSLLEMLISRLNSDGTIDTTFGNDGLVVLPNFSSGYPNRNVAVQSNGKIILAGRTNETLNSLTVYRLNTNGTIDAGFGTNGKFTIFRQSEYAPGISYPQVAIQPDDKIIISGVFSYSGKLIEAPPPLLRLNADGTADSSFIATTNIESSQKCGSCTSEVNKILLNPDGKFYLVGVSGDTDYRSHVAGLSISRYNSDGSIDNGFGFRGTHYVQKVSYTSSVNDAALQDDGKILINVNGRINSIFDDVKPRILRLNATETHSGVRGDFDGDGKTDFAVFRPNEGNWYVFNSSDGSFSVITWGNANHILVPRDYNYDGKTDIATFGDGRWWITPSQPGGGVFTNQFYTSGDIAAPGDYDGDGLTDSVNFRPSDGKWHLRYSSLNHYWDFSFNIGVVSFGLSDDKPVPGDYDGDGRTDIAVFRPSDGVWYILRSSDDQVMIVQWGSSTDIPVQADYDGDGKTDLAVFRDGVWYVLNSSNSSASIAQWGLSDDIPVPGDYDGDDQSDFAIFRPSEGNWYVYKSSDTNYLVAHWGQNDDIPIPSQY